MKSLKSLKHVEIVVTADQLKKLGWVDPTSAEARRVTSALNAVGFEGAYAYGGRDQALAPGLPLASVLSHAALLLEVVLEAASVVALNRELTAVATAGRERGKARQELEKARRELLEAEQAEKAAATLLTQAREQAAGADLVNNLNARVATAGRKAGAARRKLVEASARLANLELVAKSEVSAAYLIDMWQELMEGVTGDGRE